MTAPTMMRDEISPDLNQLRLGSTYSAVARGRTMEGVYLGMETLHGDRAILLRNRFGTASILLNDLAWIEELPFSRPRFVAAR